MKKVLIATITAIALGFTALFGVIATAQPQTKPEKASIAAQSFFAPTAQLPCGAQRHGEVSKILAALKDADQTVRSGKGTPYTPEGDLARRKQVAQLFAEGCFSTGADYYHAALIYQHGTVPDHFYQTYIWANRADELGHPGGKDLVKMGIDRYLMNRSFKQLFNTQMVKGPDGHWCVWPAVEALPETTTERYEPRPLGPQLEWLTKMNNGAKTGYCAQAMPDPPTGLFPGIW